MECSFIAHCFSKDKDKTVWKISLYLLSLGIDYFEVSELHNLRYKRVRINTLALVIHSYMFYVRKV